MNNFKKEGFRKGNSAFGGKPRFGGPRSEQRGNFGGGDRNGEERQMFKAVCSSCRQSCDVPFRPTGEKPVYCRECFTQNSPRTERPQGRSDGRRNDFGKGGHSSHEAPRSAPRENGNEDIKRQIANLEAKVDHILRLLNERPKDKDQKIEKEKDVTPATPEITLAETIKTATKTKPKAKAKKSTVVKKAKAKSAK
jgi:CxxC-x17-CxxC domain-containing protein